MSDCAVKEAKAVYDHVGGAQAAIDLRSALVFPVMAPGTVSQQTQSVPPPVIDIQDEGIVNAFGDGFDGGQPYTF